LLAIVTEKGQDGSGVDVGHFGGFGVVDQRGATNSRERVLAYRIGGEGLSSQAPMQC